MPVLRSGNIYIIYKVCTQQVVLLEAKHTEHIKLETRQNRLKERIEYHKVVQVDSVSHYTRHRFCKWSQILLSSQGI